MGTGILKTRGDNFWKGTWVTVCVCMRRVKGATRTWAGGGFGLLLRTSQSPAGRDALQGGQNWPMGKTQWLGGWQRGGRMCRGWNAMVSSGHLFYTSHHLRAQLLLVLCPSALQVLGCCWLFTSCTASHFLACFRPAGFREAQGMSRQLLLPQVSSSWWRALSRDRLSATAR